ncbi:MAG: DUF1622 domain-containing protein [Gemmataceae bacterium]
MTTEVTAGPLFSSVVKEHTQHVILYLADGIQLCAAALIGLAALQAAFRALLIFFRRGSAEAATEDVRLRLGRWLVLALEFQVAADILRTAATPTWTDLGQLAAVIVLRTVLNYVLRREIAESARRTANGPESRPSPAGSGPTVPG